MPPSVSPCRGGIFISAVAFLVVKTFPFREELVEGVNNVASPVHCLLLLPKRKPLQVLF